MSLAVRPVLQIPYRVYTHKAKIIYIFGDFIHKVLVKIYTNVKI